jgi:hypothetical protein
MKTLNSTSLLPSLVGLLLGTGILAVEAGPVQTGPNFTVTSAAEHGLRQQHERQQREHDFIRSGG